MKKRLTIIVLVMALGGWLAAGDNQRGGRQHPRPRDLEQRVAELEQLVYAQSQQIEAQQAQIDRFAPLADEMEVITMSDGSRILHIPTAGFWVSGHLSQVNYLSVVGNIYLLGQIIYP